MTGGDPTVALLRDSDGIDFSESGVRVTASFRSGQVYYSAEV
jgi:hypothetical protein